MGNPVMGATLLALFFGLPVLSVVVPRVFRIIKAAELHPLPHPGGLSAAFGQTVLGLFARRISELHPVIRETRALVIEVGYMASWALFVYLFFAARPYPRPDDFYLVTDSGGFYRYILLAVCMLFVATGIPGFSLAVVGLAIFSHSHILDCFWPMLAVLIFGPYVYLKTHATYRPRGTRGEHNSRLRDWFRPEGRNNPTTRDR